METHYTSFNSLWSTLLIEELVRTGTTQFFLSPGSRSSPITTAAAEHPACNITVHFDERGAAFAAVNYARALRKPAVLVCTSGTAAANYFPAVVEAFMSHLPLIILTADRPPELYATGANQTINQVQLYGDYVRWFVDLPCPDDAIAPETILTTVDQAVYRACHQPAGPVHLNCKFREPLASIGEKQDFAHYLKSIRPWMNKTAPYTTYQNPSLVPQLSALESVADVVKNTEQGIIIAGRTNSRKEQEAIGKLCRVLNWSLFADITAGLRTAEHTNCYIPFYSVITAYEHSEKHYSPVSTVIHLGEELVSKQVWEWLNEIQPENFIHVAPHPLRYDINHQVTSRFECDLDNFVDFLLPFLSQKRKGNTLLSTFKTYSSTIGQIISEMIDNTKQVTEPAIARLVAKHIENNTCLFLGNSMPVRDFDMFADFLPSSVALGCNRGASGIDGTISSALGFAMGQKKPCTLVTGDLAFLHDINAMAMMATSPYPMTIIVINNDGGGIFSFLPIAQRTDIFESYWGTPHGLTFDAVSTMFHCTYFAPSTADEFVESYRTAQQSNKPAVIEIHTERNTNYQFHAHITEKINQVLRANR